MKARVTEVHKSNYKVIAEGKEYKAELVGKLLYNEEFPVVGDYCEITPMDEESVIILSIDERKSFISRPDRSGHDDSGSNAVKEQAMVANVDYSFIITSMNDDFSPNRIARYAAISLQGGCKPVAILTKADLTDNPQSYLAQVKEINSEIDAFCISSYTGEGLEQIEKYLHHGNTIALFGSSGAGKSTLINTLSEQEIMKVGDIREKDSKGRHTTTHRQMIEICDTYFIDTPGMRELAMCDVSEGIDETFEDIAELVCRCKFSDCTHTQERGCAVLAALESGELSEKRWALYQSLQEESSWNKAKKHDKMVAIAKYQKQLKKKY